MNVNLEKGKFNLEYEITTPQLKVIENKYRYLAIDFCDKFQNEFDLEAKIIN